MERKRLGLSVVACAAVLFLLASGVPVSAQTGMLKGKVLDAKDAPVEGAKVTIAAKGMKNSREVKTNKKGEFIQIGLFPGEYNVTAEKDGDAGTVSTRVAIGDNPEIKIRVGKAGPSPEASAKAAALQKSFDDGVALSKAGDYDGSVAKFNEAIAQAPNCHDCYYNIGFAHMQKKEWDKAEVAFKKATELKPDYAEAWSALSNTYNSQKSWISRLKPVPMPPSTAEPLAAAAAPARSTTRASSSGTRVSTPRPRRNSRPPPRPTRPIPTRTTVWVWRI